MVYLAILSELIVDKVLIDELLALLDDSLTIFLCHLFWVFGDEGFERILLWFGLVCQILAFSQSIKIQLLETHFNSLWLFLS